MLYTATYNTGNSTLIEGVEIPVLLPDMPPLETMINYGLPKEDQKFKRTVVPGNLRGSEEEAEFVAGEWHKRWNGVWVLICGEPTYITGAAYFYFNYWYAEYGDIPDFRFEAVWFFQALNMVEKSLDWFGILDIKARRLGDTEKVLCYGYELCTRYRQSHFGMINKNDVDAKKNFDRVTQAHEKMVWFFKPEVKDKDRPEEVLEFRFKPKAGGWTTSKREIGSKITYQPTKKAVYDGERLRFFHGDEPGKVKKSTLDYKEQWRIIKQCISLNMGSTIVGKAALTTTIEDMDSGENIALITQLWEDSNPQQLNANGRTISGLLRMFRGYTLAARCDEYGRPRVEELVKQRAQEIAAMEAKGDLEGITGFKRLFPASIADALSIPASDCILHPGKLDWQMARMEELSLEQTYPQKPVRGNFAWTNGIGSDVRWVPDPSGLWEVSGHPLNPNAVDASFGLRAPGNVQMYAGGADPVDDHKPKSGGSNGGLVINALPNNLLEPSEANAFSETPDKESMLYGRPVCTYKNRPENPYLYYEHCLMTVIYYGCLVMVERPKTGFINWCIAKGYHRYLAVRPGTRSDQPIEPNDYGCPATTENIMAYETELRGYIAENYMKIYHLDLLSDARQYNGEKANRTKRDLTVAWGWSLLLTAVIRNLLERRERASRSNQRAHAKNIKRYKIIT